VAFYVQHPEYLYAKAGEPRLSNRMRERLALAVMSLVGASFIRGDAPWSLHALTRRLGVPMHSVLTVVEALCAGGFLTRSAGDPPAYLPSRDLAHVSVAEVLASVRRTGEDAFLHPGSLPLPASLEAILEAKERAITASTGGISIADMAEKAAIDAVPAEEKFARGVARPAQPV
jgi:membrane protein